MKHKDSNHDSHSSMSVNVEHDNAIIKAFKKAKGKKVFILTPSFPFLFIGVVKKVVDDLVVLDVDTTQISQLENREWYVHIHQIEVFYIEEKGAPKIPELKD
jgi:hypothetical protein